MSEDWKFVYGNVGGDDKEFNLDEVNFYTNTPCVEALLDINWQYTSDLASLPSKPGIYILHSGIRDRRFEYLYVGMASILSDRLYNHPRWRKARKEFTSPKILYWGFEEISSKKLLLLEMYMICCCKPLWNLEKQSDVILKQRESTEFIYHWDD